MGWIKSGERMLSSAEFDQRARRAAGVIAGFGVGKGDGVAFYLRNDLAYFEGVFGAGMLGISRSRSTGTIPWTRRGIC